MIITDVTKECARQHELWGEQNYEPAYWISMLSEQLGDTNTIFRHTITASNKKEKLNSYVNLRNELIRLASLTVSFVESLDRNELKKVSGKRIPLRKLSRD
jgi:hypothetical protein